MVCRSAISTILASMPPTSRFAIAIIATPAEAAQEVLRRLADAGVRSRAQLCPAVLRASPAMEVRNVDLSTELQILSFYLHARPMGVAQVRPILPQALRAV